MSRKRCCVGGQSWWLHTIISLTLAVQPLTIGSRPLDRAASTERCVCMSSPGFAGQIRALKTCVVDFSRAAARRCTHRRYHANRGHPQGERNQLADPPGELVNGAWHRMAHGATAQRREEERSNSLLEAGASETTTGRRSGPRVARRAPAGGRRPSLHLLISLDGDMKLCCLLLLFRCPCRDLRPCPPRCRASRVAFSLSRG